MTIILKRIALDNTTPDADGAKAETLSIRIPIGYSDGQISSLFAKQFGLTPAIQDAEIVIDLGNTPTYPNPAFNKKYQLLRRLENCLTHIQSLTSEEENFEDDESLTATQECSGSTGRSTPRVEEGSSAESTEVETLSETQLELSETQLQREYSHTPAPTQEASPLLLSVLREKNILLSKVELPQALNQLCKEYADLLSNRVSTAEDSLAKQFAEKILGIIYDKGKIDAAVLTQAIETLGSRFISLINTPLEDETLLQHLCAQLHTQFNDDICKQACALIENGAAPYLRDKDGQTPLHHLVQCTPDVSQRPQLLELIRTCLLHGASPISKSVITKDCGEKSPLDYKNFTADLEEYNDCKITKPVILGEMTSRDPNSILDTINDCRDWILNDDVNFVEQLLKTPEIFTIQDDYGNTLLHYIMKRKGLLNIRLNFKKYTVSISPSYQKTGKKYAPVVERTPSRTVISEKFDTIPEKTTFSLQSFLLSKLPFDPNIQNNSGHSVLHYAAELDQKGLLDGLVARGGSLSLPSQKGRTPMMVLAANSRWASFQKYFAYKKSPVELAKLHIKTTTGKTCTTYAYLSGKIPQDLQTEFDVQNYLSKPDAEGKMPTDYSKSRVRLYRQGTTFQTQELIDDPLASQGNTKGQPGRTVRINTKENQVHPATL